MEGPAIPNSSAPADGRGWQRDLGLIVVLTLTAGGIRAWHLYHTEVAARDSIGYIRYAWQLKHHSWKEVLSKSATHPGYPLAILGLSELVRHVKNGPEPIRMQLSAQLTNALASVLLVIPMFYLGRELFNRRVGFWASLLFQCLPDSSRVLSDGLSEGLFLLFAVTALWAAAWSLRRGSVLGSMLMGLFGGLAYLTRPEGALIIAAVGLVLFGMQASATWRRPWRRVLTCAAGLGLTAAVLAGPFIAVTGRLTTKPTAHRIFGTDSTEPAGATDGRTSLGTINQQVPLAVWWQSPDDGGLHRTGWGLFALISELVQATLHVAWLPGLLALWWFRDRSRRVPGMWVVSLLCLMLSLVLWRMATVLGYLSGRHTLLLILCASYWIAAGTLLLGDRLAGAALNPWVTAKQRLGPVLLLTLIAAAMPRTLETLHSNRGGLREAGLWLAENSLPTDPIIDPYYWSHFYAGRVFTEGMSLQSPPDRQPTCYVVLERGESEHIRLPLIPEAERLKDQGRIVYHWSGKRGRKWADVFVYAVTP